MSLLKRGADAIYTFRFLKLLTTSFEDTPAYELGLIDKDGKRDKSEPIDTDEKKSAYTMFHRLVFNVKRLMSKVPGGGSKLASYASALFLIKETYGLSDKSMKKIIEELDLSEAAFINESNHQWFVLEDDKLSPGIYKITEDKALNSTGDLIVNRYDKIKVRDDSFPVGEFFGMNVYEAIHVNTNQKIYITPGELLK